MGTTAHPHPRALASSSLPGLPFVSSRPGVVSTCPCLVGAGGNSQEAPNTKNMPTTAGFSCSGGREPTENVSAGREGVAASVSNGGGGNGWGMAGDGREGVSKINNI